MNKLLNLLLILCFAASIFTGCGNDNSKPATAQPVKSAETVQQPSAAPQPAQQQPAPQTTTIKSDEPHKYTGAGPNGEGIKGHIDKKKGTKIYHLPGDQYYNRTTHVSEWFFTEKDAQAAGYRPILR